MISRFRPDQKAILAISAVAMMTAFIALVNMSSLVFLQRTALTSSRELMASVQSLSRPPTEDQARGMEQEFADQVTAVLGQAKSLLLITTLVTVILSMLIALLLARSLRNTPMPDDGELPLRPGAGSP